MRALLWIAALAAAGGGVAASAGSRRETFSEDLLVKPLPDGKVLLHFEFSVQRALSTGIEGQHSYRLFPRQIGEIALRYGVRELQLAFTQGGWRDKWGYAPVASQGAGAEILARIEGPPEEAARQWKGLANALSGVFCASLNFVGQENTSSPRLTFAETTNADSNGSTSGSTGGSTGSNTGGSVLKHGYLPRENVCTENLTPWIKQLPCQSKSGIAALLNPHRLFNMHFHSMGASLAAATDATSGTPVLHYKQHVSVVLDPSTFGLGSNWTLGELMDRDLAAACPVASQSTVRVVASRPDLQTNSRPDSTGQVAGHTTHTFDLQKRRLDDIGLSFGSAAGPPPASTLPAISAHRYVTGHGGISGGIEAIIVNRRAEPVRIVYLDVLPWYLRVYSHTLKVESTAAGGRTAALAPSRLLFTPAVDRGRPSSLEVEMYLPPNSHTTLRFDCEKGFLKYTEHPPDANRGFNIGPAIVSYELPVADPAASQPLFCAAANGQAPGKACAVRIYTELFLASLPTPDFSMPYNVVSLTCTVLALFFGRVFNLLTRDFAILKQADI
ncbi:Subunit of the glycosylphosphatidylinositol transamidase complex-like protein [Coemansia biformis]|uniref:Subunit of the glycosylphosphatidylinositol transamidase complex-like protein n=1 Tax=Coemansia biformis TaxID=1286918 RepID=A0A9W7YIL9_9FUNG|nr:Subunit of the glycosylphosphatidylinositol transamidase complex-like protein [Coemansia biformis]